MGSRWLSALLHFLLALHLDDQTLRGLFGTQFSISDLKSPTEGTRMPYQPVSQGNGKNRSNILNGGTLRGFTNWSGVLIFVKASYHSGFIEVSCEADVLLTFANRDKGRLQAL